MEVIQAYTWSSGPHGLFLPNTLYKCIKLPKNKLGMWHSMLLECVLRFLAPQSINQASEQAVSQSSKQASKQTVMLNQGRMESVKGGFLLGLYRCGPEPQ